MSKFELKWGILATGGIAVCFAKDLTIYPESRGIKDIKHTIAAAASSTSTDRARQFLEQVGAPDSAKGYGSYKELVADPNVDIIYIATPHSHHYQNAMLCLEAGKPVLCEKSFTVNAAQCEVLIKKAREKNLFLMEAVWTRYMPISIYVRDLISKGKIGPVDRVFADLSIAQPPEKGHFDDKHRMVNPDLAGGALLDLGIYSLTWVFQSLYTIQKDPQTPTVISTMRKNHLGTDDQTTMIVTFPRVNEGPAHGIATTSLRADSSPGNSPVGTAGPAVRIQGHEGEIQVYPPIYRPSKTRVIFKDGTIEDRDWPHPGPGEDSGYQNQFGDNHVPPGNAMGMCWEADECAYALRDGRKEGQYESLDESLTIMKIMDEVRRQGDMKLPEKIETTDYPVDL